MTWTDVSAADWVIFAALVAICATNCYFVGQMTTCLVARLRHLDERIDALESEKARR
jgi:hypothetical protein